MYLVDEDLCNGCGACVDLCAARAIRLEGGVAVIDQGRCSGCGRCFDGCMFNAVFELHQPAGAHEPAAAYPARPGGPAERRPHPPAAAARPRPPGKWERAGSVAVAVLPVALKLAGALADYLSARAGRPPGPSAGSASPSRGPGSGSPGRRHRRGRPS